MLPYAFCRRLFVAAAAWPITLFWTGYALRGRERLPQNGPAIVIANHNSHLDALLLLTFFPLSRIPSVRVAAAADYFFTGKIRRFFAEHFMGLLPLQRHGSQGAASRPAQSPAPHIGPAPHPENGSLRSTERDPLAPLAAALERGEIVILFPEGTRGRPDAMQAVKPGLWHLARRFPGVPIHPVYLHGPGRSLPKGAWVPVPLFVDVRVGEHFFFSAGKQEFLDGVHARFMALRAQTLAGRAPMLDDDEAPPDE